MLTICRLAARPLYEVAIRGFIRKIIADTIVYCKKLVR